VFSKSLSNFNNRHECDFHFRATADTGTGTSQLAGSELVGTICPSLKVKCQQRLLSSVVPATSSSTNGAAKRGRNQKFLKTLKNVPNLSEFFTSETQSKSKSAPEENQCQITPQTSVANCQVYGKPFNSAQAASAHSDCSSVNVMSTPTGSFNDNKDLTSVHVYANTESITPSHHQLNESEYRLYSLSSVLS